MTVIPNSHTTVDKDHGQQFCIVNFQPELDCVPTLHCSRQGPWLVVLHCNFANLVRLLYGQDVQMGTESSVG